MKKCGGKVALMRKIEEKVKKKKVGEKWQKKWRWWAKQRVRCRAVAVCPPPLAGGSTSPLIPLTISGHFTHTTISQHSPTGKNWTQSLTIPTPRGWGEGDQPPRPQIPFHLTWGTAGGVERRNISKMWHCLLSGCLGWLTDWPGGAQHTMRGRAGPQCLRLPPSSYPHLAQTPTCPIRATRSLATFSNAVSPPGQSYVY